MWLKNKNTKTTNKNTRCARQMWKWIFNMLTYANMIMKRTWQSYDARLCLIMMLDILKEMKGPTSVYTPLALLGT
jgi:hypothetical protein